MRPSPRVLLLPILPVVVASCAYLPAEFQQGLGQGDVTGVLDTLTADGVIPVAGARVRMVNASLRAGSNTQGRFFLRSLPAGDFTLDIGADLDADGVEDRALRVKGNVPVRGGRRGSVDLGTLRLLETGRITGRVVAPALDGVVVAVMENGPFVFPAADGTFTLDGILPGVPVTVQAGRQGAVSQAVSVEVPAGETVTVEDLVLADAAATTLGVQVTLVDEDRGEDFYARGGRLFVEAPLGGDTIAVPTGSFTVDVPAGIWRLWAADVEGYFPSVVQWVALPRNGPLEVVLFPQLAVTDPCRERGDQDGDGLCMPQGTECDVTCTPSADGTFPAACSAELDCDDDGDGQSDVEERGAAGNSACRCGPNGPLAAGPSCDGDPYRFDLNANGVCDLHEPQGGDPGIGVARELDVVLAASMVKAGVSTSMTVRVFDSRGNAVTNPALPVTVTSTDAMATLPDEPTLMEHASMLPVVFRTPGTATVTVSATGLPSATSMTIMVVAPVCGDGETDSGELCDDGNTDNTDTCTQRCRPPECGDGYVNNAEACDDANGDNNDGCTTACREAWCGDGLVETGEACDDGNTDNTDACTQLCRTPFCGDGFVNGTEACDDGNTDNSDACTVLCEPARCGDGIIQPPESCDGDNDCSATCRRQTCHGQDLSGLITATPALLVTNTNDDGPGSLRQVLADAAADSVVGFDASVTGAIILAAPITIARNVTLVGRADLSIALAGPGRLPAINGMPQLVDRGLLVVPAGVTLRVRDLVLRDAYRSCGVTNPTASTFGGAIENSGAVHLFNTRLENNVVGSDPVHCDGAGGGIHTHTGGILVVSESTFDRNESYYRSDFGGGALSVASGAMAWVCRSVFHANVAHTYGGVAVTGGALQMDQVVMTANAAYAGAAIYARGAGTLQLTRSTVVGNLARGGGSFAYAEASADIRSCTVLNNDQLMQPSISGNITLTNTVMGNLTAPDALANDVTLTSNGYNILSRVDAVFTPAGTDLVGTSAMPRATGMAPFSTAVVPRWWDVAYPALDSPALNTGDPALAATMDARMRTRGNSPDRGAAEAGPLVGVPAVSNLAWNGFDVAAEVDPNGSGTSVRLFVRDGGDAMPFNAVNVGSRGMVTFNVRGLSAQRRYEVTVEGSGTHGTARSMTLFVDTPAFQPFN